MPPELPNRRSIRMKAWDYTTPGWYFVTISTHKNRSIFGNVVSGRMVLNEAGKIAEAEWHKSATLRENLVLDEFVVMPNHVHGVVGIVAMTGGEGPAGEGLGAPGPYGRKFGKPIAALAMPVCWRGPRWGFWHRAGRRLHTGACGWGRMRWCNHYVLAHCNRMVIGHLNPDGMLACVLSEAPVDLEIRRQSHAV